MKLFSNFIFPNSGWIQLFFILNFELLISKKLYNPTLNITIIPPRNVSFEIDSSKKNQTQNGPNENSSSIK